MGVLSGAVDRIEGSLIFGWACLVKQRAERSDRVGGAVITVLADNAVIGRGVTTIPRPDVGGDFGFQVACAAPVDPLLALGGRVRVMASVGTESADLAIASSARSRLVAQVVSTTMRDSSVGEMDFVREALSRLPKAHEAEHMASRTTPEKQRALRLLERFGRGGGRPVALTEITSVPIQVGFVCADGSALIGYDGEVYLIGGGNHLLEQFLTPPDDPAVDILVAAWHSVVVERSRLIRASGCRFLQVIIPEKLSVYPQQFPIGIATPSPLLGRLEAGLAASEVAGCALSGLRELRCGVLRPSEVFPRLDSHLTVRATYILFAALLRGMGLVNPFCLDLSARELGVGDLAEQFFGIPLYEEYEMPSQAYVEQMSAGVELVAQETVEGHIGTMCVWRNETAPMDLKVVAFANSFFGRGGNARALSWWCCRMFREFHFIWNPALDMGYVGRERPDWVICQTIERFLPMLPRDVV